MRDDRAAPELLSLAEAARRLNISTKVLRGHVRDGAIAYIEVGHGNVRKLRKFDPADLQEFCDARRRRDWRPAPEGRARVGRDGGTRFVYDFTRPIAEQTALSEALEARRAARAATRKHHVDKTRRRECVSSSSDAAAASGSQPSARSGD